MVPSPAPKDVFSGTGGKLQYPAPVVEAGYICNRLWKKNGASLEIISVVSEERLEMAGPGVGHFYLPYILSFWYEIVCFQPQPEKLLPQINEPSSATKSPYSY